MALPDDDAPSTASFAALDHDGMVVATVTVALAAPPPVLEGQGVDRASWQLRGMATRPDLRSLGIGGAVLERALSHVAEAGGGLLWCNARVPAVSLYRRAGFAEIGTRWVDPEIGPHVVMCQLVDHQPSGVDT
jgi:GNAT superfamily N-acetyltransferase